MCLNIMASSLFDGRIQTRAGRKSFCSYSECRTDRAATFVSGSIAFMKSFVI